MRVTLDTQQRTVEIETDRGLEKIPLYSRKSFELLSDLWLKVGWDQKYSYTFTWLGRPIIQLPEDAFRIQEVIFKVQPDVIIETGVANGGSLILYATLCQALSRGKVIGIDIEIRPRNRAAIQAHPLASFITLIEGSSTAPDVIDRVRSLLPSGGTVLVILDSCHTKEHVRNELDAYHSMISPGSYLVATDGIMRDLADLSRGQPDWTWNNPVSAVDEFLKAHSEFTLEQPPWLFNESSLTRNVTYWPGAFLKRTR